MNVKIILAAFTFEFVSYSCGLTQTIDSSSKPKVLVDAEKMVTALVDNDFKTYADFNYPKLLEQAGGKEQFVRFLEADLIKQKERGGKFHKISVTNPSKEVECNGELQCVLRQESTLSLRSFSGGKPFTVASNLIGISTDKGKSWTFLDVFDKNVEDIKKLFPNICDNIPLTKP
jgi:hypothetical protein